MFCLNTTHSAAPIKIQTANGRPLRTSILGSSTLSFFMFLFTISACSSVSPSLNRSSNSPPKLGSPRTSSMPLVDSSMPALSSSGRTDVMSVCSIRNTDIFLATTITRLKRRVSINAASNISNIMSRNHIKPAAA